MQIQVLKYLENSFESLSLRVKFELFLFPLLIVALLVYFTFENKEENLKPVLKNIDINKVKMKKEIVDILKDIENYVLNKKIVLHSIQNNHHSIKIEITSNIRERLSFIKYLEDYNSFSKIKSLDILEDKLIVELEFKKFYTKKSMDLNKHINSLNYLEESKEFHLQAVVDNRAFINNKWIKVDEELDSFKVYKIEKNRVILKNSYETLILKMYKK